MRPVVARNKPKFVRVRPNPAASSLPLHLSVHHVNQIVLDLAPLVGDTIANSEQQLKPQIGGAWKIHISAGTGAVWREARAGLASLDRLKVIKYDRASSPDVGCPVSFHVRTDPEEAADTARYLEGLHRTRLRALPLGPNSCPCLTRAIIFGSDQEVAGVMRAVRRMNASKIFSWIGSDGWSARDLVSIGNEEEVEGTLSVQPQANPVKGFEEYFLSLTVENNKRNPWFVGK
ncbi:unnamed protein product [Nezara viridula]|uniref:Uncharacterized protein n=1 Tax=Nezara viridula TaxID=85310 RepID=A0A9P0HMQ6_NEZVI|nr:unnamed protein product [Nezara viridula]